MFWTREMFGTDLYHVIHWFLIYSILGWVIESIYMSICNRKLTNRGFVVGPLCPIYGVGALSVFFLLRPFAGNIPLLYIMGCIFPTLLEYITAKLMLFLFGEVWWDYSEKPFNYKGILCLESTAVWGVYTVCLFLFLQSGVEKIVDSYSFTIGCRIGSLVMVLFTADFIRSMYIKKKDSFPSSFGEFREEIKALYNRF